MDLRKYRKKQGLTAAAFGERIGRSVATISRIERGLQALDHETVRAIVEATGGAVTADDLFANPPPDMDQRPPVTAGTDSKAA